MRTPPPLAGGGWGEGATDQQRPPPPNPLPQGEGGVSRLIFSAIHATRAGFILCSGRIGPFGSHHRAASASNRAISVGENVVPDMVAPAVPRQYDHLNPTTDNWPECHAS